MTALMGAAKAAAGNFVVDNLVVGKMGRMVTPLATSCSAVVVVVVVAVVAHANKLPTSS